MAVKNTSFGRKNISSAVYKLILLSSALRESFDAVELSAVQSRFSISSEEAAILMELLQLTDENGYLPLPPYGRPRYSDTCWRVSLYCSQACLNG